MQTKLSPLVAAVLNDYAYTDLSAYLLDYQKDGFTVLEISTQSGFPYATSFLTQIKTEIFAPLGSNEKVTIMRRTEEFEWIDEPWILSGIIKDTAVTKLNEGNRYLLEQHVPRSL